MSKPTGYRLDGYGRMITDRPRMEAYARALRQAVRPGCVVLDIGAGTGIFSILACQFGAGEVHAVEPNEAITLAPKMATANGCGERMTCHRTLSTAVNLTQKADVIISDLRGFSPLFQQHIPTIADARRRLLAPGGTLIPQRDTVWAALLEDVELYRPYAEPWLTNDYALDLSAARPLVVNRWRKVKVKAEQLLVAPERWATLDYGSIGQPNVAGELSWTMQRVGTAHGLVVWFDAELGGGIGFSNAPGQPELIYGQAFFPLQAPVDLAAGDRIAIQLQADLVQDDYVWRWDTQVTAGDDSNRIKASFRQSTFYGAPLALDQLRRRKASYIPPPAQAAEIDRFVLSMLDGRSSLGEIAAELSARFPQRFARQQDALTRAADVAGRYAG